jgi:succinate-acetate transporter protein
MVAEKNVQSLNIIDVTSNPAPLGLLGFGMTTVLLNIHNAGFFDINAMILGMGIFYGGLAQIIVGIMEWKKNNTFGETAFTSYGLFWLSLVAIWVIPHFSWGESFTTTTQAMGAYLFMWGLFTLVMFIGTLRITKALQFVFGSLALLFFLLAIGNFAAPSFAGDHNTILIIAGYEGIICGLSAIYTGLAQVLNEVYGRVVWPLGPVNK